MRLQEVQVGDQVEQSADARAGNYSLSRAVISKEEHSAKLRFLGTVSSMGHCIWTRRIFVVYIAAPVQ